MSTLDRSEGNASSSLPDGEFLFRKTQNYRHLSVLGLYVILSGLLLDIGGGMGLKYPAIGIGLSIAVLKMCTTGLLRTWWIEGFLILYLGTMAVFSLIKGTPASFVYGELSFVVFFCLLPLLKDLSSPTIQKALFNVVTLAALMVVLVFFIILLDREAAHEFTSNAEQFGWGYIGLRPGFDHLPNVYFRWSLWLIFGLIMVLYIRKTLSALFAFSIIMTLSTGMVSGLVLSLLLVSFFIKKNKLVFLFFFIVLIMMVPLFYNDIDQYPVIQFLISKFSAGSDSTSAKLGHIESIIKIILADWSVLLFGMGPGAEFYSIGAKRYINNIEVSHFNVLRQYGVFGACLIFGYVMLVIYRVAKCGEDGRRWAIALLVMFLIAGTNPVFISPIFFVPLLMARMYSIEWFR